MPLAEPKSTGLIEKKAELRAALALAGETMGQFVEACGVSRSHFEEVMAGKRISGRLEDLIDAKIFEFRAEMKRRGRVG